MSKALDSVEFLRHRKSAGRAGASAAANTASIQAAIDALYAAGGGVVELPPGTLSIAASTLPDVWDNAGVAFAASHGALSLRSGVYLRGRGVGVTTLSVEGSGSVDGILVVSPLFGGISDLTLDGNWDGLTGVGHGIIQLQIVGQEYCKKFRIERCQIRNFASYGIGIENGDVEDVWVCDNTIFNTGADGVDIKAERGAATSLRPGIVVRNNHVSQWGRRSSLDNQAGLDIRGVAVVEGNTCENKEPTVDDGRTRVGIRARAAATGETYGSQWSRIIGNFCHSDMRRASRGIVIDGPKVICTSNTITGQVWGVRVGHDPVVAANGQHALVSSNNVHDCQVAYATDDLNDAALFSDNFAQDVSEFYRLVGDNAHVSNSRGINCTTVFRVEGDSNTIDGGRIAGSVTTKINDTGTGNTFQNVQGVRTRSRANSGTFAIDSTGVKTVTVPHSLDVTPAVSDVVATVHSTTTTDQRLSAIEVTAVDATNVTLKVYVITASGTGGATARLTVDVNTERI